MTQADLTPTETIYLHAPRFAREKGFDDWFQLPHVEQKVRASDLSRAMLTAALLQHEQAGTLRLNPGLQKKWFGLRSVPALYVEPAATTGRVDFPEGTLEGRVQRAVTNLHGPTLLESVVATVLGEDASMPAMIAPGLVEKGMAERQLLETEEVKRLKVFKTRVMKVPESTLRLAQEVPPEPVAQMLESEKTRDPERWTLLEKGIQAGVERRRETSDNGPDFD